jgi:hypothetical protein
MNAGFAGLVHCAPQPNRPGQPSHVRALHHSGIHGPRLLMSPLVQLIWIVRNTRSGCDILAVKRPVGVATALQVGHVHVAGFKTGLPSLQRNRNYHRHDLAEC